MGEFQSFRKGTWGAEIVEVLTPAPGCIVIEGGRGLCGFAQPTSTSS